MWGGVVLVRSEAIYPSPVFIISSFPFTLRGAPRAKNHLIAATKWRTTDKQASNSQA